MCCTLCYALIQLTLTADFAASPPVYLTAYVEDSVVSLLKAQL